MCVCVCVCVVCVVVCVVCDSVNSKQLVREASEMNQSPLLRIASSYGWRSCGSNDG